MKNIDVDIYMTQLKGFFEKNPNSLVELIGNMNRDDFFNKVEEQCYKNANDGDEISLTQKQLIDIVVTMNNPNVKNVKEKVSGIFQKTRFGLISLN